MDHSDQSLVCLSVELQQIKEVNNH